MTAPIVGDIGTMPITQKRVVDGAKVGGSIVGGSLLLGPVLGPVAGGAAASYLTDDSTNKRLLVAGGIGAGLAGLFLGSDGGSGATGSHTPAHRRGHK